MSDFIFALTFLFFWVLSLSLFIFFLVKCDLMRVDSTLLYLGRKGNYLHFAYPYNDGYFGYYAVFYNKNKPLCCQPLSTVKIKVSFSPLTANGIKLKYLDIIQLDDDGETKL